MGHVPCPPLDFQLFNFSGHFKAAQTLTLDSEKNIQAYSFVTGYCMNFIIFMCVTVELFSPSFVPLLAPNPTPLWLIIAYATDVIYHTDLEILVLSNRLQSEINMYVCMYVSYPCDRYLAASEHSVFWEYEIWSCLMVASYASHVLAHRPPAHRPVRNGCQHSLLHTSSAIILQYCNFYNLYDPLQ